MGKKLETIKAVAGFSVSIGAGIIIGNAINATTPVNVKKITKFFILVGGGAIGGWVGEKASEYVNEQIDDIASVITAGAAVVANVQKAADA